MTNEDAIEFIKTEISRLWDTSQCRLYKEAFEMAIKALEQKPCDAVSREAVLEGKIPAIISGQAIDVIPVHFIKRLSSVQPKQRTGEWIRLGNHQPMYYDFKCSACKGGNDNNSDMYCRNCGAKMQ